MARGKFITVEGIEGTGKSTNIEYLTSLIEENGFEVLRTREPGGTPMPEKNPMKKSPSPPISVPPIN